MSAPLRGEWRHNEGVVSCGTLRIFRTDFDTAPTPVFASDIFDWVCQTLNEAQQREGVDEFLEHGFDHPIEQNKENAMKQNEIDKHMDILGRKVKDSVTGQKGVATSVAFDLFGCVQVILAPGVKKDNVRPDGTWYDIGRLEVADGPPVMDRPDYVKGPVARGEKGPEAKPIQS